MKPRYSFSINISDVKPRLIPRNLHGYILCEGDSLIEILELAVIVDQDGHDLIGAYAVDEDRMRAIIYEKFMSDPDRAQEARAHSAAYFAEISDDCSREDI